jgi:hypothetical protein
MSILAYAYEHDKNNLWFCLLTDSCVPIISPEKFRKLFFDHYQASIIRCKPAYWDIKIHRRANLRLLQKEFWLANDPWFTLCRDHVHKCILFLTLKNDTYQKINMGGLANESIFAIILQTFEELTNPVRMINESSTITDWTRMSSPTSPYTFRDGTIENIDMICKLLKENKYTMFLRKVNKSFPDQIIKDIMGMDYDHKYDLLHNQAKKKHNDEYFDNIFTMVFVSILLVGFIFITSIFTEYFMYIPFFS